MQRHPRSLAVPAALLTLVLAACGSTATPSPATSASPAPSGSASASPSPSTGVAGSPSPTPEPSVDLHGASALETRLADEIGGTTLSKVSLTGADFIAIGGQTGAQEMAGLLGELGRTSGDLTVAQAYDPTGILVFQEGLFRVVGADPVQLLTLWVASQQAATQNRLQVSTTTVGGRDLTHLVDPTREVRANTYALADGDTLWLILADDTTLLEEAVGKIQ
jgi:hypothetical protein